MQKLLKLQFKSMRPTSHFFFSKIVGVPKETYPEERRVSISPEGVTKLTKLGYEVHVERDSGVLADFSNELYE